MLPTTKTSVSAPFGNTKKYVKKWIFPLFFANILLRSAIFKYEKSGRCTCLKAETKMKSLFSLLACCPYFSWQAGGKANW
jgi:hypothetical protein